ncbi:GTPase IMAP family member 4-like [Ostrea edulis]|uniref:GTPase IMAP family member 4-like n=1 Tax=Ostrea edulis TaxID=37623 RepID=UPI002095D287|nr:GTPase IMAP family member 4-like [Ostrea edulis]XP_056022652.1 GTPase IMAP family member 4-like [Ostrea edulis]XP_056022653.1 GTPase IMAP family member 4-like [Ostrea edulis]XP_056022654.1 GTPase IMAP family member 4-like [Ostrea edulis]XP_056022655.1 GTPase IMAP family member 4-like [Ostrea edulis]XP_056022656.1 GTPase IMAP family member 4-like [Ostrea edulis]XP_056022657.1 GTPase IMAP family member 4-like [Ostrea edulis]XP_056022658.1 GTPase IMAP family member 4-like [Ostrea edulis]XP_
MAQMALPSLKENVQERRIILIGKLGAGKSHSGNGILGTKQFVSKRSWSSITRRCEYGSAIRDGFRYRIYDTPGVNSPQEMQKKIDVETDIKRCLYCTSPGFHAIVLVLSASERIAKEDLQMLQNLDVLLEESAFEYMILVITKLENDENELNELLAEAPEVVKLNVKCGGRHVIFGDDKKEIPKECVQKFDNMLTKLIKENSKRGKEYYRHKFYDQATKILEKDKNDYMKKNPGISESDAFETVRNNAAEGRSPRDDELKGLKDPRCAGCSIS